jgi:hypothetical protein
MDQFSLSTFLYFHIQLLREMQMLMWILFQCDGMRIPPVSIFKVPADTAVRMAWFDLSHCSLVFLNPQPANVFFFAALYTFL